MLTFYLTGALFTGYWTWWLRNDSYGIAERPPEEPITFWQHAWRETKNLAWSIVCGLIWPIDIPMRWAFHFTVPITRR